jgi:hypothetical protein
MKPMSTDEAIDHAISALCALTAAGYLLDRIAKDERNGMDFYRRQKAEDAAERALDSLDSIKKKMGIVSQDRPEEDSVNRDLYPSGLSIQERRSYEEDRKYPKIKRATKRDLDRYKEEMKRFRADIERLIKEGNIK